MTRDFTCETCGKSFRSQKDSTICYSCALAQFVGDGAPEEGDFNSALLVSGEMTNEEARWLQEDLRSVDHSEEDDDWDRRDEDFDVEENPLYFYVPRRDDE